MQPIEISNHPQFSEIKRFAKRHKLEIDDTNKCVILTLKIEHFKESGEEPNITLTKVIGMNDIYPSLRADETTQVDANGNVVEGQGVMNEWQFFDALGEMNVKTNDITRAKIAWADSLGRLNTY